MPHGAPPRPLLDVEVAGLEFPVKALVDTGAVNTFFDRWIADEAGIDLVGAPTRSVGVGGADYDARLVTVSLTTSGHTWEAEVEFCDDWQPNWGLLGHTAFLRFFTVTFRAVDLEFELEPNTA